MRIMHASWSFQIYRLIIYFSYLIALNCTSRSMNYSNSDSNFGLFVKFEWKVESVSFKSDAGF